ncbi:hypothetical protein LTR86_003632 [Recurvomyces mirabilis]|nr:hypothetical protein LTR86_003632 [Recurvomyces mirabilis]
MVPELDNKVLAMVVEGERDVDGMLADTADVLAKTRLELAPDVDNVLGIEVVTEDVPNTELVGDKMFRLGLVTDVALGLELVIEAVIVIVV